MSSWDQGEVLKLSKHGNDYATKVWLANAPPVGTNGRPKEGDDINVFKRFIVDVYEKKLYYCEPAADENGSGGVVQAVATGNQQHLQVANNRASQQLQTANRRAVQPKKPAPPAPAQQQPAVDLLDFGTFDNALPSVTQPTVVEMTKAAAPTTKQVATSSSVQQPAPFDPFNMNQSQSTATSTTTTAAASNNASNVDPFASSVASTPSNTTNAFGTSKTMGGGASNDAPFDPFSSHGGLTSSSSTMVANNSSMNGMQQQQQSQPVMKTPVMNSSSGSGVTNGGIMNGSGNNNNMFMNNSMMMNGSGNQGVGIMNGSVNQGMGMMNGSGNNMMMMNGSGNTNMMNGQGVMMNGSGNNMMMNNNMMLNSSQGGNMGMLNTSHQQQQPPAMAMNMNIMQPRNNSISNMGSPSGNGVVGSGGWSGSGGSSAAKAEGNKSDPFAGLGF